MDGGGSHDVDIIIGGELLNDDAWLQRGEGCQKSVKKWLRNMWTLPFVNLSNKLTLRQLIKSFEYM